MGRKKIVKSSKPFEDGWTRKASLIQNPRVSSRLPVKQRNGILKHVQFNSKQVKVSVEESRSETPSHVVLHQDDEPESIRTRLSEIANLVLTDPEANILLIKEAMSKYSHETPEHNVLVMISVTEMFGDIIPSYKFRTPENERNQQPLSKEVLRIRTFEAHFLRLYAQHISFLEELTKNLKLKAPTKTENSPQHILEEIALRCATKLLQTGYHFNFAKRIIQIVVPFLSSTSSSASSIADVVCDIFKSDSLGDATLEIMRTMNDLVKKCPRRSHSKILTCMLSLPLLHIDSNQNEHKKKPRSKIEQELDRDLQKSSGNDSSFRKKKLAVSILDILFSIYFRILKCSVVSENMAPLFLGISKFAFLIDIDLIITIVENFTHLMSKDVLSVSDSGLCLLALLDLLKGRGECLIVDLKLVSDSLYRLLLTLPYSSNISDFETIISCLNSFLVDRKESEKSRIMSFLKRTLEIMILVPANVSALFVQFISSLIVKYQYVTNLFEEALSSGIYQQGAQDSSQSNIGSALCWEVFLLLRSSNPYIKKSINQVLCKEPITVFPNSVNFRDISVSLPRRNIRGMFLQGNSQFL